MSAFIDANQPCKHLSQADTLAEMLADGLHTACGQLPRASELLSLEWIIYRAWDLHVEWISNICHPSLQGKAVN